MSVSRNELRQLLVLAVLCGFLFFFGLANFGLLGADEPRYAQIAREMLARNDWVTPRLQGEVWLEKPVLYYWLEMAAYKMFGVSDWAARLPAAVLAAILIAAIYLFARRFRPGLQFDAAVLSASAIGIFSFARGVSTDLPLAAFFTMAMLSWWAWAESTQRKWLLGFYFLLALATLAKGPVAIFLAALVLLGFAAATRDAKVVIRSLSVPGILLFCAVALPWYVLVQLRNPQFLSEFILRHNLARFSSDLFRHTRPFWYYLPVLLLGLLPWTTLGAAGAIQAMRKWRSERDRYPLFLLVWGILPVLFFSLSQSKLPGYILPAIPAWTLLAATYLQTNFQEQRRLPGALLVVHGLVSSLMVATVAMAPQFMLDRHAHVSPRSAVAAACLAGMAFLLVAGLTLWRGIYVVRFATLIPLLICLAYVLRIAAPVIDLTQSARSVAKNLEAIREPVAVFQVPRALEYGLGFYRNEKISSYERGEIPGGDHFLLAKKGTQAEVAALLMQSTQKEKNTPGRTPDKKLADCAAQPEGGSGLHLLATAGGFPPQNLEYYSISMSPLCLESRPTERASPQHGRK